MVGHVCDASTWETEAGVSPCIPDQPGLHSDFTAGMKYMDFVKKWHKQANKCIPTQACIVRP